MPVGQITFPSISIAPSIYKISNQKVWSVLKAIPNDAWVPQIATTTSLSVQHLQEFTKLWEFASQLNVFDNV
jgi:hypothetical protein